MKARGIKASPISPGSCYRTVPAAQDDGEEEL